MTFPGPHRLSNGDKVKVLIPGKAKKSNTESVAVVVISPLQLKVRYTDPALQAHLLVIHFRRIQKLFATPQCVK